MRSRGYPVVLIAIALLAACDVSDPVTSPRLPSLSLSPSTTSEQPFYYYEGNPVYLQPKYSKLVVAYAENIPDVSGVVRQVLGAAGLSVTSSAALTQIARHQVFSVAGDVQSASVAISTLRQQPGIEFAAPAYTLKEGQDTLLLVNELIVHFKDGVARTAIDSFVAALGARIVRPPRPDSGFAEYRIAYPIGADPLEFAARVHKDPLVEWADPNKIGSLYPGLTTPSDPYYSLQYYFANLSSPNNDINIEPAWSITLGGGIPSAGGIWVAVIDDGVEADHPDFGGQVEAGFAYDAIHGDNNAAANPTGLNSHGTNVAGMIIGQHSNTEGVAGGAPAVHLVPVRIYTTTESASDANVADAITYAWNLVGADVLSNSWRWPHTSTAITNAINNGAQQGRNGKGATIVFAAGNTSDRSAGIYGALTYPGYLSSVIAVGAIDRNGNPANYTPRGPELDIVAPSGAFAHHFDCDTRGDVVTTELTGSAGCNDGPNGDAEYTENFTGTSAAAPQVAAAAALLYSDNPTLTGAQVRQRLLDYADFWGRSDDYGSGKLNVYEALRPPLVVIISGPSQVAQRQECDWEAVVSGGEPPYSYKWYKGTTLVGTGSVVTILTGTADFRLEVDVTDGANTIRSDYLDINVGGGDCGT